MIHMEPMGTPKPGGPTPPITSSPRRGEVQGGEERGSRSSGVARTDQVQLSSRAEEFRRVRSKLDGLPEAASQRVAALKSLIDRGAYVVNGEQIADAMLRDQATAGLLGFGVSR
jgi:flagellar biosynthesis anti-sigma factor FlgM